MSRRAVLLRSSEPGERPTSLMYALVEAIVPEGEADAVSHFQAIQTAASFLRVELAAQPVRDRWPFWIGMTTFLAITGVRFGRSFCRLSLAKRRRWVRAWAWGPMARGRRLFRTIRSIALLAYFETLAEAHGRSVGHRRAA